MAGIMANSATETMVAGDTSADNTHSGYLTRETITLSVTGSPDTYLWSLAKPSASGSVCALNDTDESSVTFAPDVEGYYVITCLVDGATLYVLRISAVQVSALSTLSGIRMMPLTNVQVPTPATGQTLFYSSDSSGLAVKDSSGVVDDVGGSGSGSGENFRATYYVDPLSTELPANGSEGAPYTTIAAAFADAVAAGYTAAVVYLAPGSTITENVVFPNGGGTWQIEGLTRRATITGTCVCDSVTQSVFTLRNIQLSGALTGNATSASGNFLFLRNCYMASTVTLTGTGSGVWYCNLIGEGTNFFAFGGAVIGAMSTNGQLFSDNWYFGGAVTTGTGPNFLTDTRLVSATFNTSGLGCILRRCEIGAAITISGTGTTVFDVDSYTANQLFIRGVVLSGAVMKTLSSNLSARRTLAANVVSTPFNGQSLSRQPLGLYECVATGDLLAAGTSGTLTFNVIYTDMTGTLQTLQVCTGLAVNGVVGTEMRGSVYFSHDGTTSIAYSVTGVSVAGSLSYSLGMAIRRVD